MPRLPVRLCTRTPFTGNKPCRSLYHRVNQNYINHAKIKLVLVVEFVLAAHGAVKIQFCRL